MDGLRERKKTSAAGAKAGAGAGARAGSEAGDGASGTGAAGGADEGAESRSLSVGIDSGGLDHAHVGTQQPSHACLR